MNDLEERLRAALDARAATYTTGSDAYLKVRSRTRRTRRRPWLALVPVAAAATAIALTLNLGDGRGDVTTGVIDEPSGGVEQLMTRYPPVGEPLTIDEPSEHRPMRLWFAKAKAANGGEPYTLCSATQLASGAGLSFCPEKPDLQRVNEQAWYGGGSDSAWPSSATVMSYGAARKVVTKVEAVTKNGARIPGTIHRPKGAPLAIWDVSFSSKAGVTRFEFSDDRGKIVQRVKLDAYPQETKTAKPVEPILKMPGALTARLYAHPDRTVVWSYGGNDVGLSLIEPRLMLTDVSGDKVPVELSLGDGIWYGIARAGTIRISVIFKDGTSVTSSTVPDPWGGTVALFSGTHQRSGDTYRDGFQTVGYDASGVEIWRDDRPAAPPFWQLPQPIPSRR